MLYALFVSFICVSADAGCETFGNVLSTYPFLNLTSSLDQAVYDSNTSTFISSAYISGVSQHLLAVSYNATNISIINVFNNNRSVEASKLAIGGGKVFAAFTSDYVQLLAFDIQSSNSIVPSSKQPVLSPSSEVLHQIHYYGGYIYLFTSMVQDAYQVYFVRAYNPKDWLQVVLPPSVIFNYTLPPTGTPFSLSWCSVIDINGIVSIRTIDAVFIFDLNLQTVVYQTSFNQSGILSQPALLIPQPNGNNLVVFATGIGFLKITYPATNASLASMETLNYINFDWFHRDYTSCSYSDSLSYVICLAQNAQDGLDIYFAPNMTFTRSYIVNKNVSSSQSLCTIDGSRNLLLCTSARYDLITVALIDLSGEICAPGVVASSTSLPQGDCTNRTSPFCVPCQPGLFVGEFAPQRGVDLQVRTCLKCPIGQQSSGFGASSCTICPNNTFSADPGAVQCRECPVGSQMRNPTVANVMDCVCSDGFEFSSFSDGGLIVCKPCQLNEYKDKNGACTACPSDSISSAGACQCKSHFYQNPTSSTPNCSQCPSEGAECADNNLEVSAGYWRSQVLGEPILCAYAAACPSGTDYIVINGTAQMNASRCASGYGGILCGACEQGYAKDSSLQSCVLCPHPSVSYWVSSFVLGGIFIPYYVIFASSRANRESADFMGVSLVLFYLQLLAQLSVPLPSIPWLVAFDFSSVAPVAGCVAPISTSQQWVLLSFGYPCWLLATALLSLFWVGVVKHGGDLLLTRMTVAMVSVTDLLFISHTKHLFAVFPTRDVDGVNRMLIDPSVNCPGKECDGDRAWALVCLVCMFAGLPLIKVLFVPGSNRCGTFGPLERCRARIKKRVNLNFYAGAFTNNNPWWEAVWTLRRATVVTIASLTKERHLYPVRSVFLALAMACWVGVHLLARPHGARLMKSGEPHLNTYVDQEYLNTVEVVILITLCISFFLEILAYIDFATPNQISITILILNLPCMIYLTRKVLAAYFMQLVQKAKDKLSPPPMIETESGEGRPVRARSTSHYREESEVVTSSIPLVKLNTKAQLNNDNEPEEKV